MEPDYTLVTYTCSGQKSRDAPKCRSHTPAVGKSLRDAPQRCLHTPAVGKSVRGTPKRCSNTPAVGKSLQCGPLHSLGFIIMLIGVLEHLFGALTALKSLINGQTAHFSTFHA